MVTIITRSAAMYSQTAVVDFEFLNTYLNIQSSSIKKRDFSHSHHKFVNVSSCSVQMNTPSH